MIICTIKVTFLKCQMLFYVLLYVTLCPFKYCNHIDGEERAGCFA